MSRDLATEDSEYRILSHLCFRACLIFQSNSVSKSGATHRKQMDKGSDGDRTENSKLQANAVLCR